MTTRKNFITVNLIALFLYFFIPNASAQITPGQTSLDWFTHAGNNVNMQPSGGNSYQNMGMGVAVDEEGNVYTIGMFWGTINFGSLTLTTGTIVGQGEHCFITKQDPNGNYIWAIKVGGYPGSGFDNPGSTTQGWHRTHMIAVKNGSIYVCGQAPYQNVDFNPGPGTNTLSFPHSASYILKLDTAGNFNWVKAVMNKPTGGLGVLASGIGVDDNGNCYVVGVATRSDTLSLGSKTAIHHASNAVSQSDCIFYAKLDPYGNCDWLRVSQNGYYSPYMYVLQHAGLPDIAVTPNGNLFICCPFAADFWLKTGPSNTRRFYAHLFWNGTGTTFSSMMFAKINTNGWVTWGTEFGRMGTGAPGTEAANLLGCSMAYNSTADKLVLNGSFQGSLSFHNPSLTAVDTLIESQNNVYGYIDSQSRGIYMVSYDVSTPTPVRGWIKNFIGVSERGPQNAKNIAMDDFGNVYTTDLQLPHMDYTPDLPSTTSLPANVSSGLAKYDINGNFKWLTYASSQDNNSLLNMLSIAVSPCNDKVYTTGWFLGSLDVDPSSGSNIVASFSNPPSGVTQTDIFTWALDQDDVPNPVTIASGYNSPLCVGQFLQLQASASGGISYSWTGPNGFTSAQQNPGFGSITATDAGDYIVTVKNATGCSNKDTVHVSIGLFPPNAGTLSSTSTSLCEGSNLNVTTNGNPGGTWQVVNAGGTATVNNSGLVTGVSSGFVVVKYIDTKSCGADTASIALQVLQQPNAGILSGSFIVCENATDTISSNGDSGGAWSVVNSAGSATVDNAGVVSAISPGFVTVKYIVSNACGTDTTTKNLLVMALPNAGVISGPASICKGDSITLTSNGTTGGTWSSSNGFGAYVNASGVVIGVLPGNYEISYVVSSSCGTDTAYYNVAVTNVATAGTISGVSIICVGDTFNYSSTGDAGGTWSVNNNNATINASGAVTATAAGTVTISYIVNGSCGSDTTNRTITIQKPANAGNITGVSNTVCLGSTLQLTSSGDAGGTWSASNSNVSVSPTGEVTGITQGTSTVEYIVTSIWCGSDTATYNITIETLGTKTVNSYKECEGFTITVNGNTYNSTGTYTDYVGCDTIITQLTIAPGPQLILNKQDASCDKNNGGVTAVGITQNPPLTYNWDNNSTDSILMNLSPGIYTVIISDSMGCTTTGNTTIVNINKDCGYIVSLPGAFTPNGDGKNDILFVNGKGIKSLDFKVFNRWGNLVFETTDPNKGWDGVYKGKEQNTAVFMYTVNVTFKNGETATKSGDVGLIR